MSGGVLLTDGEAALARGDWASARSLFAEELERDASPDAAYGLARAEEWAGDFRAAVGHYERAYAGFRARGELRRPALIAARELSFLHAAVYGNSAAADGWLARARSLAREAGTCPELGWLELAEALTTDDPERIEAHARAADVIGGRYGDADLRFCAQGYRGLSLVLRGRVAEGMRHVDEAAAAATSGEVRDHLVVGEIYCKMLLCCELVLDVRRGQEWVAVADAAGRTSNDVWVSAICRMHYGGILTAAGRWAAAERELTTSIRLYDVGMRALRSGAVVRLAHLRVRQGRLPEAAGLLAGHEEDGAAVLPLARMHLLRGEPEVAAAVLRRHLGAVGSSVLDAPSLALLAEVEARTGRSGEAHAAAGRLSELAADSGLAYVRGLSESVAGVLRRVAGDDDDALPHLEAALRCFAHAGLPWESALTRLGIAQVVARTSPSLAAAEGRAALRTFRELGAARDADAAASLLRALRSPTGAGPRVAGALTRREAEVLDLVAEGLSNQAIADRLYLSKRTVEHHVGSILAKLGVTTRAEALATVLRTGS